MVKGGRIIVRGLCCWRTSQRYKACNFRIVDVDGKGIREMQVMLEQKEVTEPLSR